MPATSIIRPVVLVLAFGFLAACGAAWSAMERNLRRQGYRKEQPPPKDSLDHLFDPETAIKLKGGARVGRHNASVPLVTLDADATFIHLFVTGPWLARQTDIDVWIGLDEVLGFHQVNAFGGWGIRFETADGSLDGVLYWTFEPEDVLDALGRLGWPVDRG